MSRDIRLSPKHGVNPSLGVCPLCHREDGSILLCGLLKPTANESDPEAPRHMIGFEPCDDCKAKLEHGVLLIEVEGTPLVDGQGLTREEPTRTGRTMAVKRKMFAQVFKEPARSWGLDKGRAFIPPDVFKKLVEMAHPDDVPEELRRGGPTDGSGGGGLA
jgi:hypothetical protein